MALYMKGSPPRPDAGGPIPPPLNLTLPKHNVIAPPAMPMYNPYSYPLLFEPPAPPRPQLPSPLLNPFLFTAADPATICEAAARLLFMNVRWTKHVTGFSTIPLEDRLLLIEESWKSLFVLGSAQFLFPLDFNVLLDRNISIVDKTKTEAKVFQSALVEICKLNPDANEYAYLRGICLFKTCLDKDGASGPSHVDRESRKLQNAAAVTTLLEHSIYMLNEVRTV